MSVERMSMKGFSDTARKASRNNLNYCIAVAEVK